MKGIRIENITKSYEDHHNVVENFNLDIEEGEFVVLLGPSGCGKSTLLKILAGLEEIHCGEIYMDDECISHKEPKDRDMAMVFQNYALYPHMTVYKNIAIGLILKKMEKEEIDKRVEEVSKILDIKELLHRKPRQLSGGQMQRVALARAMIRNPKAFLMDEPLSNLDSKLRIQTRAEIMKLYKTLKTTTVYVTHDQIEAMTMANTIVLMKEGKIQQKGSPEELYAKPNNMFVAGFIGAPQMNFLKGNIKENKLNILNYQGPLNRNDGEVIAGIRPEHIKIQKVEDGDKENCFLVELVENLGNEKYIYLTSIKSGEREITARVTSDSSLKMGDYCSIHWDKKNLHVFDKTTENRINEKE